MPEVRQDAVRLGPGLGGNHRPHALDVAGREAAVQREGPAAPCGLDAPALVHEVVHGQPPAGVRVDLPEGDGPVQADGPRGAQEDAVERPLRVDGREVGSLPSAPPRSGFCLNL